MSLYILIIFPYLPPVQDYSIFRKNDCIKNFSSMLTRTNGLFSDFLCLKFFHNTSNISCDFSEDLTINRHILSSLYIAIRIDIETMTIKITEFKNKSNVYFGPSGFTFI